MKITSIKLNRKFSLPGFENFDIFLEAELGELDDVDKAFDILNNRIIGLSSKIKNEKKIEK